MKKSLMQALLSLSIISFCIYIGTVAYNWGYRQSAIDNRVAAFSAPAHAALFSGISFIAASAILAIVALIINKKQ